MKNIETTMNEFKAFETARYINHLMHTQCSTYTFYVCGKAAKLQNKIVAEIGMPAFMDWLYKEVYNPIDNFMNKENN